MEYFEWNEALINYHTAGQEPGSLIFLSVDDDVLQQIADSKGLSSKDALPDFVRAVRRTVLRKTQIGELFFHLNTVRESDDEGRPLCAALLGLMVLAASRMAVSKSTELEGSTAGPRIGSTNFFRRLREILKMPPLNGGRPRGLPIGADEELWRIWGRWLRQQGFMPTAKPGEGAHAFTGFPVSQTLLREGEKERLRGMFENKALYRTPLEPDRLMLRVLREADYLPRHLRDMLRSQRRFEALREAIYSVYEGGLLTNSGYGGQAVGGSRLYAGLYRTADPLFGTVRYQFYSRLSRRAIPAGLSVNIAGEQIPLYTERPRYLMPVGNVSESDLTNGNSFSLEPSIPFASLTFGKRSIHVLVPDPNDLESGVYATWGSPSPRVPFLLLCSREMRTNLERLRDAQLIAWDGEPSSLFGSDQWWEFCHCMTLSNDWATFRVTDRELYDTLRPKRRLYLGLSGGLRGSLQGQWLESYGPCVTVYGATETVEVRVRRLVDDLFIYRKECELCQAINLPERVWAEPGHFQVEAGDEDEPEVGMVEIIGWDGLRRTEMQNDTELVLGDIHVCGALVRRVHNAIMV